MIRIYFLFVGIKVQFVINSYCSSMVKSTEFAQGMCVKNSGYPRYVCPVLDLGLALLPCFSCYCTF